MIAPRQVKTPLTDNYRLIALAPALSKAFECCILVPFSDVFQTSCLQFGFKTGLSEKTFVLPPLRMLSPITVLRACLFMGASWMLARPLTAWTILLFKKLLDKKVTSVVRTLLVCYS